MKVIVLGGGDSLERDVSLRSATAVAKALEAGGFRVVRHDPRVGLEMLNDDVSEEMVIFPILHGSGGEDGTLQAAMEAKKLKFLGSNSTSSRLCFDKAQTRDCLAQNGLPIASGETVRREEYESSKLYSQPHVLKAVGGGSSIGTYIVHNPSDIDPKEVDEVFQVSERAVIEELIEGAEITVSILGTTALPVIEIIPPEEGEFDYENKYNGKTQELCPPVSVSQAAQLAAQRLAEEAHRVLGCRHLSRVDMMVRNDDTLVILEVNTMPGMTDQSLYPKAALTAGYTFPALMTEFVKLASQQSNVE